MEIVIEGVLFCICSLFSSVGLEDLHQGGGILIKTRTQSLLLKLPSHLALYGLIWRKILNSSRILIKYLNILNPNMSNCEGTFHAPQLFYFLFQKPSHWFSCRLRNNCTLWGHHKVSSILLV